MKKYHAWALADIGMGAISFLLAWLSWSLSANILPMGVAIVVGFVVLLLVDQLLSKWYYSGTTEQEKIHNAEDDL